MVTGGIARCLLVVGMLISFPMSGCSRISSVDATTNPKLWGGYVNQAVYRLKKDLFLVKLDDQLEGHRYALSPEGRFKHPDRFYSVPRSIEQYTQERGQTSLEDIIHGRAYQVPTTVVGVVTAGTHLRCTKLLRYHQWSWFFGEARWTMVFGKILDGQHANTLADITDLSIGQAIIYERESITVHKPIPHLLRIGDGWIKN